MMNKACVISIGNELLTGQTADTNSGWLCRRLLEDGFEVAEIWTVPDEIDRIVEVVSRACELSRIVIISGGLGPTDDDLTRQAMAEFLGEPLIYNEQLGEKVKAFFDRRGRQMPERNRIQACIPAGAEPLDNPVGTAPGIFAQKGQCMIACTPGVPWEMQKMYTEQIQPRIISSQRGRFVVTGKVRCCGGGESSIAERLGDMMSRDRNPQINSTAVMGENILHIIATAQSRQAAKEMVEKDRLVLRNLLGDWVYGDDDETLPYTVGSLLAQKGWSVATAESCTGGLIAKMLTDVPGSSGCYKYGWITYCNEAKSSELGLDSELFERFGAVSEPVARAMAVGAAEKSGSQAAISVTGIAGPSGGTDEKPVGLVYVGVYVDGKCDVKEYRFHSSMRENIRTYSAMSALNQLRMALICHD